MRKSYIYNLTAPEINELTRLGESGSKDAAFKLMQFYSFTEYNSEQEIYWLYKAAENGHPIAQYNLALDLLYRDPPDYIGARKWGELAKLNGAPKAQELLEKIFIASAKK